MGEGGTRALMRVRASDSEPGSVPATGIEAVFRERWAHFVLAQPDHAVSTSRSAPQANTAACFWTRQDLEPEAT